MTILRMLIRVFAVVGVVALAACETTAPSQQASEQATPAATASQAAEASPEASDTDQDAGDTQAASGGGQPVAIFLADTNEQEGWQAVPLESGNLYLNPEPVVIEQDMTGVQAGTNEQGDGVLALGLNDNARKVVADTTAAHSGKRLALIVGQTLLAAPGFSEPIDNEFLVFAVGTEENAVAVARAIAGVSEEEDGTAQGQLAPQE